MKTLLIGVVTLFACSTAHAGVEAVFVKKAMDDKAIVVRANGEMYLIEKGVGCLSLWRYEGKRVYINSPGLFLGVGSSLLIPDAEQQCRIWNSESLASESARPQNQPLRSPSPAPASGADETTVLIQKALRIVGYDVVADGVLRDKTKEAFARYQTAKNHPQTEAGIRQSLLSLGMDVLNKQPPVPEALQVATGLYQVVQSGPATSNGGCVDGHWISSIMASGKLIKLEDGSIWEVDPLDTIRTMLWLPVDGILVCGQTLIKTSNGDKVRATPLGDRNHETLSSRSSLTGPSLSSLKTLGHFSPEARTVTCTKYAPLGSLQS
jgi:hypothetical protein